MICCVTDFIAFLHRRRCSDEAKTILARDSAPTKVTLWNIQFIRRLPSFCFLSIYIDASHLAMLACY